MEKEKDYSKQWEEELTLIKSIIDKAGLDVEIKWGIEVYTYNGNNVVACHGFKHFFVIWFYNGVFLEDRQKKLISAGGNTKALRQWRFTSKDEIDEDLIYEYIMEAVKNEKEGRVWEPEPSGPLVLPPLLSEALQSNSELQEAFDSFPPYKKKEYAEHIGSAKRESTARSRLEKSIPMILERKGLNDKYR